MLVRNSGCAIGSRLNTCVEQRLGAEAIRLFHGQVQRGSSLFDGMLQHSDMSMTLLINFCQKAKTVVSSLLNVGFMKRLAAAPERELHVTMMSRDL